PEDGPAGRRHAPRGGEPGRQLWGLTWQPRRGLILPPSLRTPTPPAPLSRRPSREGYAGDFGRPPTPRARPAALLVLASVGGWLIVTGAGCVGFFWLGARGVHRAADEQAARNAAARAKEAALPTRAEFEKSVIGKSKDDVMARLGRPSATAG